VAQDYTNVVFADMLSGISDTPSSKNRIDGWVEDFYPEQMRGFIRHEPRNGIFFMFSDVIPDVIGRRFLKPGTVVSFELTENRDRFRALRVKDESPELLEIDPTAYTETSYVADWHGGYGFLSRPNGERLYFHRNKIITVGLELLKSWDGVNDPCWVTHRIDHTLHEGKSRFFATDVQILEPTQPTIDDVFLNAPELPVEIPEPVAAPQSVLALETRNVPIIELIRQRRQKERK
jgi:cold shock CspA family protein